MSMTLSKLIKKDNRIESYTKDIDGYWIYLKEGYNWSGCSTIHENRVADVLQQIPSIQKGECY